MHGVSGIRRFGNITAVAVQLIAAARRHRSRPVAFLAVRIQDAPLLIGLAVYLPALHRERSVRDSELAARIGLGVYAVSDTLRAADCRRGIARMKLDCEARRVNPLPVKMYHGTDRRRLGYDVAVRIQIILRVGVYIRRPGHAAVRGLHGPAFVVLAVYLPAPEGSVRVVKSDLLIGERRRGIPVINLGGAARRRVVVMVVVANRKLDHIVPGGIEMHILAGIDGTPNGASVAVGDIGVAGRQCLCPAFRTVRLPNSPGLILLPVDSPAEEPLLLGGKAELLDGLGLRVYSVSDRRRGSRRRGV